MSGRLGLALLLGVSLAPPALSEQTAPGTVALSPEERAAVLESAARNNSGELAGGAPDRRPHGEVGFEVSSRGGTALYGSTIVPVGDNALVGFSFLTANQGRWRGR